MEKKEIHFQHGRTQKQKKYGQLIGLDKIYNKILLNQEFFQVIENNIFLILIFFNS